MGKNFRQRRQNGNVRGDRFYNNPGKRYDNGIGPYRYERNISAIKTGVEIMNLEIDNRIQSKE